MKTPEQAAEIIKKDAPFFEKLKNAGSISRTIKIAAYASENFYEEDYEEVSPHYYYWEEQLIDILFPDEESIF